MRKGMRRRGSRKRKRLLRRRRSRLRSCRRNSRLQGVLLKGDLDVQGVDMEEDLEEVDMVDLEDLVLHLNSNGEVHHPNHEVRHRISNQDPTASIPHNNHPHPSNSKLNNPNTVRQEDTHLKSNRAHHPVNVPNRSKGALVLVVTNPPLLNRGRHRHPRTPDLRPDRRRDKDRNGRRMHRHHLVRLGTSRRLRRRRLPSRRTTS